MSPKPPSTPPQRKRRATPATAKESQNPANPMWGARFDSGPDRVMEAINASIGFDHRLYAEDLTASRAHCEMLVAQQILDSGTGARSLKGLDQVLAEIEDGSFTFRIALEDGHLNIEARLAEIIGEDAGRLHTARSRNDQVATDFRLWVRDALAASDREMRDLQAALIDRAEEHAATVMPGFTHLQSAQPVTFGHHLLAYVEMVGRDRGGYQSVVGARCAELRPVARP